MNVVKMIMTIKTDAGGNLTSVRIVATGDDGSHPYGEVIDQLTTGEKNALKAISNKIASGLEDGK